MFPIQKQEGPRGLGMGYGKFVDDFNRICQKHVRDGRARAFAFVFYDPHGGVVREALKGAHGFNLLHKKTGHDITLFYLHDSAADSHWRRFNKEFMEALGVQAQVEPPCLVFFRVNGDQIEDVWPYQIDERTQDPVLVVAEMEGYVDEAIAKLNAEGDISAITGLGKVATSASSVIKLVTFIMRLKGAA